MGPHSPVPTPSLHLFARERERTPINQNPFPPWLAPLFGALLFACRARLFCCTPLPHARMVLAVHSLAWLFRGRHLRLAQVAASCAELHEPVRLQPDRRLSRQAQELLSAAPPRAVSRGSAARGSTGSSKPGSRRLSIHDQRGPQDERCREDNRSFEPARTPLSSAD